MIPKVCKDEDVTCPTKETHTHFIKCLKFPLHLALECRAPEAVTLFLEMTKQSMCAKNH